MKLLLDTCVFLWLTQGEAELSKSVRELIEDENNTVIVSAISNLELQLKNAPLPLSEKIPVRRLLADANTKYGIRFLPLYTADSLEMARLPSIHKDPFDRMLICQAMKYGFTLISPDEKSAATRRAVSGNSPR
jgi:PIN domain nuclease of toxin-antitoxin system